MVCICLFFKGAQAPMKLTINLLWLNQHQSYNAQIAAGQSWDMQARFVMQRSSWKEQSFVKDDEK